MVLALASFSVTPLLLITVGAAATAVTAAATGTTAPSRVCEATETRFAHARTDGTLFSPFWQLRALLRDILPGDIGSELGPSRVRGHLQVLPRCRGQVRGRAYRLNICLCLCLCLSLMSLVLFPSRLSSPLLLIAFTGLNLALSVVELLLSTSKAHNLLCCADCLLGRTLSWSVRAKCSQSLLRVVWAHGVGVLTGSSAQAFFSRALFDAPTCQPAPKKGSFVLASNASRVFSRSIEWASPFAPVAHAVLAS